MKTAPNQVGTAILLGAGGHAKVVLSLARLLGWNVIGVCDPALTAGHDQQEWRGVPVLGSDAALAGADAGAVALLNGVGQIPGGSARQKLFEEWSARHFRFPVLIHPSASVDPSASLDDGVQIMAGAVIQADARVGRNTIVNTRASIDHDGVIGAHVHIAPGATLCGSVQVGDAAYIGAGATVVQGVHLGGGAFLTAGALLTRDLREAGRWPEASRSPGISQEQNT
ncbi:MAG TPA: acetyltransferase [Burkholderiaceae bacterium]|nr:acetyltransferase [Burkholderiaceae bacterium]